MPNIVLFRDQRFVSRKKERKTNVLFNDTRSMSIFVAMDRIILRH